MTYQDLWLNGKMIKKGIRECAHRYELVKSVASTLRQPFTVCDIGANMCYFGLRLAEDFDCRVLAFESATYNIGIEHLRASQTNRIFLLKGRINLKYLDTLCSAYRFDLVLALSILHHVKGMRNIWIEWLRKFGDSIIIELAMGDRRKIKNMPPIQDQQIPEESTILGWAESHLSPTITRPILLLEGTGDESVNERKDRTMGLLMEAPRIFKWSAR